MANGKEALTQNIDFLVILGYIGKVESKGNTDFVILNSIIQSRY